MSELGDGRGPDGKPRLGNGGRFGKFKTRGGGDTKDTGKGDSKATAKGKGGKHRS